MKRFTLSLTICSLTFLHAASQRVIEVGIKPTEYFLRNFEVNAAIGNSKVRYGIFLSFRPSTQSSGEFNGVGSGAAGGYGYPHFNKLYNSYTVGLYQKTYINKKRTNYVETDIFYRNWWFNNKQALFKNSEGYRFDGIRTEKVNVYGLKLLIGETIILTSKESNPKLYLDVYGGIGIRYKVETYETVDGYVYDDYYTYRRDRYYHKPIGIQAGVKLGLLIGQ